MNVKMSAILTETFFSVSSLGRVHSAMVSKLNPAQRSVTVEWYERGETKGKEVELDVLLELNPELIRNKQTYVPAPPPTATTAPVNLQRVSQISREIEISFEDFLCGGYAIEFSSLPRKPRRVC